MANVKEEVLWEDGIYQLETTDPVMGGPDGIDNKQAQQLANRTLYLKQKVEAEQPTASLTQKGIVQLNSSTDSESETEAATPKAVKAVKDALSGYLPASKSGDEYKINDDINFQKTPKINDIELVYLTESYRSGYSWYEKYSNGEVIQGGIANISTAQNQTVVHATVNLFVPVIDNTYCVNLTAANSAGGWGFATHTFSAQSKTGFIISSYFTTTSTYESQVYWETRGVFK